ncbi:PHP domain protein [Denitrovibrio acetiphilus DSM 12809]|uniref:PHP domain protein n=1 Tax=Denitrovibrio acetiphilus (strain DSM 12809 / NBRC 114555 / N2460) TaxID=522772 RepID=D4H876_DENA2|nr:PHP domain-containing protein [Denitrovibrio acetiphilus]ADD68225.1 PHP domain protein [Denitrovibrio acetiphilus DSM 12809]
MIDLHTHSTFSDGTMHPEKLVSYAEKRGVEVLALTDHDTVDGLESFLSIDSSVKRVTGVEISVVYDPGTFHLVGLFVDHKNIALLKTLQKLKDARRRRNDRLMELVSGLIGGKVTEDDISPEKDGELGRPHIAQFLVAQGFAGSMNEAFDKYLGKDGSLYLPKDRLEFSEAIDVIHEAGGIAILAHPMTLGVDEKYFSPFLKYLKGMGLDGHEVWCSDTPADKYEMFYDIAKEHGMLISGGSDFHGDNKLSVGLGTGKGDLNIPYSIYKQLESAVR